MIGEKDKKTIIDIAKRYKVERVLLFGSSADQSREGRDFDLAVEGIKPADFFKFYGDLLFDLPKPVDLIDLSRDDKFSRMILREGIVIYG